MAREDYHNARVAGRKAYRADVQAGRYPYLPALDDMISYSETQGEYPLGRVDIPLNLIVGTKTAGRQKAFASNFMPSGRKYRVRHEMGYPLRLPAQRGHPGPHQSLRIHE